ncbi:MAG: TIGR01777 family protein, partial [Elusimicrobia bacterium]|nr:TIGR01777 family protein [Elusimicrobiota bacterium]
MKILVAGGTGFIGRRLCRELGGLGHEVVVLSRKESPPPAGAARVLAWRGDWSAEVEGAGAIVNLSGAGVADRRWSKARKQEILDSRLQSTRRLVESVRKASKKPEVLVNASGVGWYGDRGAEILTEASTPGGGFLAQVCLAWEAEAAKAEIRSVFARIGVVLGREGGALPKMLPPFKFGVGGPLGSGRQYMSWIHADDAVGLLRWAIERRELRGPMNDCAPQAATTRDF